MFERDGTSQAGRAQAALDPDHVSVDERSARDLLAFAKEYAKELRFFDARDRPAGDWSGFLDLDLDELAALAEGRAAPGQAAIDRPHLALFLAFLQLCRHPRDLINAFTRRHLEHYYEEVLRMTRKAAVPDRVHVLLRLAPGAEQARLPEGSLLRAGKDSLGRERLYRTERELVVGRAAVARLCTAYVEKEITGIREARERHQGTREEAFLRMLEIALGDPRPGDALPKYQGKTVTYALLLDLKKLVDFAAKRLFMPHSDLHSMMQLKRRRDQADAEWGEINTILEGMGRRRFNDPNWKLSPQDPRDFPANVKKAIGHEIDFKQDGLPEVETIDDLYHERDRWEVRAFVRKSFFFMSDADQKKQEILPEDHLFDRMMFLKIRADNEWREVNRILERAGRRRRNTPSYRLDPAIPLTAFAANVAHAIGNLPFSSLGLTALPPVTTLDAYHDAILRIEPYFHLNAPQLGYVLDVAERAAPGAPQPSTAAEWSTAIRLLTAAHADKLYSDRRGALRSAFEGAPTPAQGFARVLRIALGRDTADPQAPSLQDLREHVLSAPDYSFLEYVQSHLGPGELTGDERDRLYRVVELAQRTRERLPEPVPLRETWLMLHASADATSVSAAPAAEDGAPRPWKTFGQRPPAARQVDPPPALIGWAISSPMLLLGQGERTLVLTLGFEMKHFDAVKLAALLAADPQPLRVELSTEKGWIEVTPVIAVGDYQALSAVTRPLGAPLGAIQLTLSLGKDAPAITAPGPDAAGIATPWPMLRWMLRPVWDDKRGQHVAHYTAFRDLRLVAAHVRTAARGLTPSAIQNDEAVLAPKKPFEPFGASPSVGSRFRVGDPELVLKRLDWLTFHVEWKSPPKSLTQHYTNYLDSGTVGPFTTRISLADEHRELWLTPSPVALFADADAAAPHAIKIDDVPAALKLTSPTFAYGPRPDMPRPQEVAAWPRHLVWELTPNDFQHQVYPGRVTQKALQMAAAVANAPGTAVDATQYVVKPPYTPKIQSLRVDYGASAEALVQDAGSALRADRLFHVHPFGISPIEAEAEMGSAPLLPRHDGEGELFIGLSGARPPQTLSLLFQMAEGSASPDVRPAPIEWRYLSGDRWLTLHDGKLLSDTTRGLIDTGIVELTLPPAEPSTRLPGGLYWLRAAIPRHAGGVCDTVGIHAQAVSAVFEDRDNAPDHHGQKLPARTITKLADRVPQIAAVAQPYPSRGGRAAEREQVFFTRVSERLRHKQRALTIWDHERLVLERFPELYKVKCLPASAGLYPDRPGAVDIVVIPGVRGQSIPDPFAPKVPASLIAEIEEYLSDKVPAESSVRVRNAHFVAVKVRAGVRFRRGRDEGYYRKLLNEDIIRFLSPWVYDESADISIGGKIFANSLVSFIDGRDYVDFVATIKLFRSDDGGRTFRLVPPEPSEGYFVGPGRPDGVLVAAPQHEIDIITEVGYEAESFVGINYMKVELDFIVG